VKALKADTVNAALVAAPSAIKNKNHKCYLEMDSKMKIQQLYFDHRLIDQA
jgi:hypothetical protein